MDEANRRLGAREYALLTLLAAVLFGYATISGKPLTMHEARLPQLAREMLAAGQWLLPCSGERPWLERPPFPLWVTLLVGHAAGALDQEWIVRIPPVLMGWLTLLVVGWSGARLLGRKLGLLSAVALATMYEFYFYAGQAEDDIFLAFLAAACIAFFVATEFPIEAPPDARRHFLGNRPLTVWLFFIVLGATSLAKGPLVGAVEILAAIGVFLLLGRDKTRLLRYVWLWGWLLFAALTVGWYLYAYQVYPSIWDNLKLDFAGTGRHQPFWDYLVNILWTTAPWTPFWILGLILAWPAARRERLSPQRFLWCWALVPLMVLSLPARKHHHYLVPILPAFAVLASLGLERVGRWILRPDAKPLRPWGGLLVGLPGAAVIIALALWHKIPGPLWVSGLLAAVFFACSVVVGIGLARRNGRWILVPILAGIAVAAGWGQSVAATSNKAKNEDLAFLARVGREVPPGAPLLVDARGALEFFRQQFYLPEGTVPLQNFTFLRDSRITAPRVYVIGHESARAFLSTLGEVQMVDQSPYVRRGQSSDDRYTLFLLTYRPDLQRYPAPQVSVTQGMGRAPGPYCGPPPGDEGKGSQSRP